MGHHHRKTKTIFEKCTPKQAQLGGLRSLRNYLWPFIYFQGTKPPLYSVRVADFCVSLLRRGHLDCDEFLLCLQAPGRLPKRAKLSWGGSLSRFRRSRGHGRSTRSKVTPIVARRPCGGCSYISTCIREGFGHGEPKQVIPWSFFRTLDAHAWRRLASGGYDNKERDLLLVLVKWTMRDSINRSNCESESQPTTTCCCVTQSYYWTRLDNQKRLVILTCSRYVWH